jgi:hypothetical protein
MDEVVRLEDSRAFDSTKIPKTHNFEFHFQSGKRACMLLS